MPTRRIPPNARVTALVRRLHTLRGTFSRESVREKLALVRALSRRRWTRAVALAAWHDELLFLSAFPDSAAVHRAARRALNGVGRRVAELPRAQRTRLIDSGIAGTETINTFMYGVGRWLAARGQRIAFDWKRDADAERIDALLRLSLTSAEGDLFDSGDVGTREWTDLAAHPSHLTDAEWLLRAAPSPAQPAGEAWRVMYDTAEVPLRWTIGTSPYSASKCRVAVPLTVRTSFRKLPADVHALLATPLTGIRRARAREAAAWRDASLAALTARAREVFPTIYANTSEIYLAPLGGGVMLCILGVAPEDRAALEANYGYVMFANGIAIGYGGVTTLGAQANTGANIFASFRHSEAAFVFAQALRAFHTLFGVTRFIVNPYQIGADNDEAIASGAYWFYDRLGFRPVSARLAALARRERVAMRRDSAHRSSRRTLRALARGDIALTIGDAQRAAGVSERVLLNMGRAALQAMSRVPAGARRVWVDAEAAALMRRCTGARRALTRAERRGAAHLMPVFAPLAHRIARWTARDRRAVWQLVALKGRTQELHFARAAARCAPLWRAV